MTIGNASFEYTQSVNQSLNRVNSHKKFGKNGNEILKKFINADLDLHKSYSN